MNELPDLKTTRVRLLLPDEGAACAVVRYFRENEDHFRSTSPAHPPDFLTERFWREKLKSYRREFLDDVSLRLFMYDRDTADDAPIGSCNFTNFVRGPFQACHLGFGLDRRCVGKGLMFEALQAAIAYVFNDLGFHRIMANHLPSNERSERLLRRLGFVVEGYARDYLYIGGAWCDHVLTSLTNPAL